MADSEVLTAEDSVGSVKTTFDEATFSAENIKKKKSIFRFHFKKRHFFSSI